MPAAFGSAPIAGARYGTASVSRLYQGTTLVWPLDADFPFGRLHTSTPSRLRRARPTQLAYRQAYRRNLLPSLITVTTDSPIIGGRTRRTLITTSVATSRRRRPSVQPTRRPVTE